MQIQTSSSILGLHRLDEVQGIHLEKEQMNKANPDPVNAVPESFEVLGKIAWLWMNSPMHDGWTVQSLSKFTLPAIESKQYLLIERNGFPVAYCSWAFLSRNAEIQYMIDPSHIRAEDWVGGDRLWFVDWVAPFSGADSVSMKNKLVEKFPNSLARAIRVKRNQKTARVMEFKGRKLASNEAATLLNQYYSEFISYIKQACGNGKIQV